MTSLKLRAPNKLILHRVSMSRFCGTAVIYVPLRGPNQNVKRVAIVKRIGRKFRVVSRKSETILHA